MEYCLLSLHTPAKEGCERDGPESRSFRSCRSLLWILVRHVQLHQPDGSSYSLARREDEAAGLGQA